MILIRKGAPPRELITYRETPDTSVDPPRRARYDGPGFETAKKPVRKALRDEQQGLCCYCNARIEDDEHRMKIEHHVPQHGEFGDPTRDLEWPNLLGACRGERPNPSGRGPASLHCDSAKGEKTLSIDPTNAAHMATIDYTNDGRVRSTNSSFDDELNEVLNLNLDALRDDRSRALGELQKQLRGRYGARSWPKEKLEKLRDLTRDPPDRTLRPFAGFLCWWLERAIRKHSPSRDP